jgi:hypothetical protein
MRTYLILKEKAARFNADADIQGILAQARKRQAGAGKFSKTAAQSLAPSSSTARRSPRAASTTSASIS